MLVLAVLVHLYSMTNSGLFFLAVIDACQLSMHLAVISLVDFLLFVVMNIGHVFQVDCIFCAKLFIKQIG